MHTVNQFGASWHVIPNYLITYWDNSHNLDRFNWRRLKKSLNNPKAYKRKKEPDYKSHPAT